jgi:hypothetical protein
MSGAGDYAFKRISYLENEVQKLKDRDTRIVTALEKRVAQLEALLVSAAKDVIKIEDRIKRLEAIAHTQLPGEIEP